MSNLPILPNINFVETDAQKIIDSIIGGYEELAGAGLAQGDPRRLFLLSLAYTIIQQRQQIDAAGKSNLLYYARGNFLDHLGAFRDVERLGEKRAVTTLEFRVSAAQLHDVGIPQGTRATHDGELYFRTTAPATIPSMQSRVTVPAEAVEAGEIGNDIDVGEINELVDPIPFVSFVTNTTVTQGGANREEDEAYKSRIYQAPAAFSIAGPVEAYIFWAFTANPAIADVSATSPIPSVAEIRPLLRGGEIPGQSVLDEVEAILSDKLIRPLADRVDVLAPDGVDYAVEFAYYIRREDQASFEAIHDRVQKATEDYVLWQKTKLGRDINPDELISMVKDAGAKRLVIVSPQFEKLEAHEIAQDTNVLVTFGGVEDE